MKEQKVKIRFVVDAAPDDRSGDKYAAGQDVLMSPASANFWVIRDKAVFVEDEGGEAPVHTNGKGPGRPPKVVEIDEPKNSRSSTHDEDVK